MFDANQVDHDFLIKAYQATQSEEAKKAIEVEAQRMRLIAESRLASRRAQAESTKA